VGTIVGVTTLPDVLVKGSAVGPWTEDVTGLRDEDAGGTEEDEKS
jgi:hypothetical protein